MASAYFNLQILLCLVYVTNALLSLILIFNNRNFPGAKFWVLGQALMALGTLFDLLPVSVFSWIPLIIGNTLYTMSCLAFFHSVWIFRFNQKFPLWLYSIVTLQLISFILAYFQPYWVRATTFSIWMGLGGLCTGGILIWKVKPRFNFANYLTGIPFFALGLCSLLRVMVIVFLAPASQSTNVNGSNLIFTAGAILLSTVTLFGYFMMNSIKFEQILRQKDEEIEKNNISLIKESQNKNLFFAIIAHDLRAPIEGSARYMRKNLLGRMDVQNENYTATSVLASTLDKTNDYLNKLLLWSKTQLTEWKSEQVSLSLEEVLNKTLTLIQTQADSKGVRLEVSASPFPAILGDFECLQIILNNLLSNAVKYSYKNKSIEIKIQELDGVCSIIIQDHGVGMDKSTLERLFRIEAKLSTLGTAQERGNGLGLILVKSLVERNGGKITLESELGQGTKVTLYFLIA